MAELIKDLSGIILCGGLSKRMGRAKSFLPYAGKTLIEHCLDFMSDIFAEVILVSNSPGDYEHLSAHVVRDIIPNRGPLVGILSGLLVARNEHSFVLPCDMPLVDKHLVKAMCASCADHDLVVYSHSGRVEPLPGVYSRTLIPSLEEAVFQGTDLPLDFILSCCARIYEYKAGAASFKPAHFNVDTPADYGRLCAMTC